MGKIILVRHGKAGFGQDDYDQLSKTGKYQAMVTGRYFQKAKIMPTSVYSGTLKRQKETAEIAKSYAGFSMPIQSDPIYNEYDYEGIIDTYLPALIAENAAITSDIANAFTDYSIFERVFNKLLKRWVSEKNPSEPLESFAVYTRRVIQGIENISQNQNKDDIAIVFTSGGLIAMSMHLLLGLTPVEALKLGWVIYNCSVTSFIFVKESYQLQTFNAVTHLELEDDGLVTII